MIFLLLSWSLSFAAGHIILGNGSYVYLAVLYFPVVHPQALLWRWHDTRRPRPSELVHPSLRLVSFLYSRWRCSARFARTSIFLHLHSWASAAAPAFPRPAPSSSYLPPRLHGFMHHHLLPPHNPLRRPVNSNVRGPLDVLYGFRGDVCVWSVLRRRGRQHEGAGRVREGKSPKPVFAWHCAALVGFASTTAVLERH
jgi:hypothetical protein